MSSFHEKAVVSSFHLFDIKHRQITHTTCILPVPHWVIFQLMKSLSTILYHTGHIDQYFWSLLVSYHKIITK